LRKQPLPQKWEWRPWDGRPWNSQGASINTDHFDDNAIQIVAWDGKIAVGCARVVLPQVGERLPTEEGFDLVVEPKGQVVDWGRNVVSRSYIGPHYRVLAALLGQAWIETRRHGYRLVWGNATAAIIRIHRMATHVTVDTLGPPRLYWGEKRYPFRFDFQVNLDKSKAL